MQSVIIILILIYLFFPRWCLAVTARSLFNNQIIETSEGELPYLWFSTKKVLFALKDRVEISYSFSLYVSRYNVITVPANY